jgi:hypothetical protein
MDFCPFCFHVVPWYHQHHGPRFVWKHGQPPFNHARPTQREGEDG